MKYMMLVYSDENSWTEDQREKCMADSTALCHRLAADGRYLAASPLHPVATATSVRIKNGKRLVTDGPFAETTEQLGGYFLIDAGNLDEAVEIASQIPAAKKGTVEIRPVFEIPGLPEERSIGSVVEDVCVATRNA